MNGMNKPNDETINDEKHVAFVLAMVAASTPGSDMLTSKGSY